MAEKKKYDSDIVGWMTRNGKRVPIRKSNRKHEEKIVALEAPTEIRNGKYMLGDKNGSFDSRNHKGKHFTAKNKEKEEKKKDLAKERKREHDRYAMFHKEHNATDFHVNEALDYMYGTDRKFDFMDFTDDEVLKALDYWDKREPKPQFGGRKKNRKRR